MSFTPQQPPAPLESIATHQRETLRQIVLPVGSGIVIFGLLLGAIFLTPTLLPFPNQVAMVANILAVLCMIIPMFLCLLPVYLLMMVLAFGTGAFHNTSANQLRRLNRLSRTVTDKTISATETINKQTVNLRVRLAGIETTMDDAFKPDDKTTPTNNNGETDDRTNQSDNG